MYSLSYTIIGIALIIFKYLLEIHQSTRFQFILRIDCYSNTEAFFTPQRFICLNILSVTLQSGKEEGLRLVMIVRLLCYNASTKKWNLQEIKKIGKVVSEKNQKSNKKSFWWKLEWRALNYFDRGLKGIYFGAMKFSQRDIWSAT